MRGLAAFIVAAVPMLAIVAMWLAACSQQQSDAPDLGAGSPALWEIADADDVVRGWAFGTIHALPDAAEWRTARLAEVVDRADLLALEVANLEDEEATSAIFADLSRSPGQPALSARVGPASHHRLARILDAADREDSGFGETETWAVALTLAQLGRKGDPKNGADRALQRAFDGRPVVELEGAKRQLAIFDSLPEAEQADLLEAVLREIDQREEAPYAMVSLWLAGDMDALLRIAGAGILGDPELREALLVQRNIAWLDKVERLLEGASKPLIAVGAAHLPGEEGLLALLARRGYRVDRIQ